MTLAITIARTQSRLSAILIAALMQSGATGAAPSTPEEAVTGFSRRVDAVFRAESGKPLVREKKNPPLGEGRGNYVRAYSYSIIGFAARCLYLGEMLDEANSALQENAQYYLDNPLAIYDRDSFHWHADIVMRLLAMYGPNGTKHPGRLTKETEAIALKPIWIYAKSCSWLGKAEYKKSQTWHLYCSENHDTMDSTVNWHFAKFAKDRPEYKNLKYDDGSTAAEQYKAWNEHFIHYCLERARKGICIEMRSDGYNSAMIRGIYNFHDFGDACVKRSAEMLLHLYFAYWAEEQIDGHMGGGGSRLKGRNAYLQSRNHKNASLAWFYFGMGSQPDLSGADINTMLSDYRPPAVVADIALDAKGRGRYEVLQRVQGLGKQGHTFPMMNRPDMSPTKFRTDGGGVLRYSFCDPSFIMGTPMTEARPMSDWGQISIQNRWQGVIFAGKHDPRIVPLVRPKDNRVAFNAQWSVQCKGSLMTQKIPYHKGGAEMMVWMSKEGLGTPVDENGIVFVEAEGAYAAVRAVACKYTLGDSAMSYKSEEGAMETIPPGWTMIPTDEFAPVILEVMAKTDVKSFDAFKTMVKACKPDLKGSILTYKTIYGDELALDTKFKMKPAINGSPVDYAPKKVYASPFLNADYDRGVVTISKGARKIVLDFNEGVKP